MENCDYSGEKRVIEYLSNITSDTTHAATPDITPATNGDESSKDNIVEIDNENKSSNEPTLSDEGSKIAAAYLIFGFMGIGLAILFACFYYHDFDFKLVSLAVLTLGLALVVICMELGSTNKINNCETTSNGTNPTDDVAQAKISKNGNPVIQYPELQNILDQIEKKLSSGYEFRSITVERYKRTYLAEITKNCTITGLPDETIVGYKELLELLLRDMYNVELENAITESNTSLTTLQTLSKVDGLKRDLIQDFYERSNTNERGNVDERGNTNEKYHKNS
ncbi:hypothetical protein [Anaerobutyricum hallii]|uniref:hypothetical protein n=1 Tax=Anaerobutyricum hallii TaxID=39488 RepID=UPI00351FC587